MGGRDQGCGSGEIGDRVVETSRERNSERRIKEDNAIILKI